MGLELSQLKTELAALKKLKPGAARTAAGQNASGIALLAVAPGSILNTGELDDTAVYYNENPPAGTQQDPYLYLCAKGTKIKQSFLQKMLDLAADAGTTLYARVEYRKDDKVSGELLYAYVMTFGADGTFEFTLDMPEVVPPSPSPSPPSQVPALLKNPSRAWNPSLLWSRSRAFRCPRFPQTLGIVRKRFGR